ncbi:LysR family transcriptional regulator [Sandaracinobacteroides saxicola]|uniref:LysR family transcriptional regulator n=1 Tax=Sandaracinobacteroides saxicola TaxID=2759707 RepID=A0A7G5IIL8_9SPHN|nr:LysR family transcriptional regulator [Sandaracinobacteroides saxicola]QMW23210.1 LysR family transcriptional regulator [Sandaracinobacteroides saxicola]
MRYVIAAAETGSFRRAALLLGVAQSAISRRIREVEEEIGGSLFHRHATGAELTQLGTRFLRQAQLGANHIGFAIDSAKSIALADRGLRIGIFGPLTLGFLSELFGQYRRDNPQVKLRFSEGSSLELVVGLRRRQLDVAVLTNVSAVRGYQIMNLWKEFLYLAMADSDILTARDKICWNDLRNRHFVVTDLPTGDFAKRYLQQMLEGRSDELDIEQLSVTRESLMQIVAQGGGVTIVGSAHSRFDFAGISFRPIDTAPLSYAAMHASGSSSRDLERLLSSAKSLAQRDDAWFAQQGLIRPSCLCAPPLDRHRGARGRTPDRLQ